jgi:hypothetical protein
MANAGRRISVYHYRASREDPLDTRLIGAEENCLAPPALGMSGSVQVP